MMKKWTIKEDYRDRLVRKIVEGINSSIELVLVLKENNRWTLDSNMKIIVTGKETKDLDKLHHILNLRLGSVKLIHIEQNGRSHSTLYNELKLGLNGKLGLLRKKVGKKKRSNIRDELL